MNVLSFLSTFKQLPHFSFSLQSLSLEDVVFVDRAGELISPPLCFAAKAFSSFLPNLNVGNLKPLLAAALRAADPPMLKDLVTEGGVFLLFPADVAVVVVASDPCPEPGESDEDPPFPAAFGGGLSPVSAARSAAPAASEPSPDISLFLSLSSLSLSLFLSSFFSLAPFAPLSLSFSLSLFSSSSSSSKLKAPGNVSQLFRVKFHTEFIKSKSREERDEEREREREREREERRWRKGRSLSLRR